jgi:hypothetical protein
MQPAQDPSPRHTRRSRTLKDLRSHLRPVKSLQILINARLKRLASAVQLRPWPPSFQRTYAESASFLQSAFSPLWSTAWLSMATSISPAAVSSLLQGTAEPYQSLVSRKEADLNETLFGGSHLGVLSLL